MSKLQRYLFFKVAPFLPLLLGQAFSATLKTPHKINVFPLSRGNSFKSHLPHFLLLKSIKDLQTIRFAGLFITGVLLSFYFGSSVTVSSLNPSHISAEIFHSLKSVTIL